MLSRMGDYRLINKAMWDERAPAHAASADYGFDRGHTLSELDSTDLPSACDVGTVEFTTRLSLVVGDVRRA